MKRLFSLLLFFSVACHAQGTELLTDPFLQDPGAESVKVVWLTEYPGRGHGVIYGERLNLSVKADTQKLTHVRRETPNGPVDGLVWRHEAQITGLTPGVRVPYRVYSIDDNARAIWSSCFTLAPAPRKGDSLKILFTSDHQNKPMATANLQKVQETVGRVDAIFFAGDMVDVPDDADGWFHLKEGGAFFPSMQGRDHKELHGHTYHGGQLLQTSPLYTTIGNHEVMGVWRNNRSLQWQFFNPRPKLKGRSDNESYNTETYEQLFSVPKSESGGKKYYAVTVGDIRMVVLYATRVWRTPLGGKYDERNLDHPEEWGGGDFIFESIEKGSEQYRWLEWELKSNEFQQAKYKVVMLHHPMHSLGANVIPAFTNPIQNFEYDEREHIAKVNYSYPLHDDHLIRDLEPLLEQNNVDLVLFGHSHLWNRFRSARGMNYLDVSNVGSSYGSFSGTHKRQIVPRDRSDPDLILTGDPYGYKPIVPTIAPLKGDKGRALPYIASNTITVFTIFDTTTGEVMSYYFDTEKPDSAPVKFDSFPLKRRSS